MFKNKKVYVFILTVIFFHSILSPFKLITAKAEENTLNLNSQAAILMEASTGEVIYEKNPDEELRPASITKIMTLLLIFENIAKGKISLEEHVTVSEHAASLGGSQVYLEPGEMQTVNDMIKCISIASANDASVAMAEHIAGSEEAFVKMMNEKASELSMLHTNFVNCYGLDTDNHYSSARDVAIMSRELITKYPQISSYSTVWMDTITHVTKKGSSEFGLTNTNKLIKSYQGITGLKTGSTGLAKYCLSATACRNDINLISVIMAAPDTKTRFKEAAELLNYGFANCYLYKNDGTDIELPDVIVKGGKQEKVSLTVSKPFTYLFTQKFSAADITTELEVPEETAAPVLAGQKLGEISFLYKGECIGKVDVTAVENIEEAGFAFYLDIVFKRFF